MNIPKKSLTSTACAASVAALFLLAASPSGAQEKRVTFKTADGKYVAAAEQGAFNLSGKEVNNRTVFAIEDTNGGKLEDGDEVTIKYYPSADEKASIWQNQTGKLIRAEDPGDATSKFKLKKQGEGFVLQSGEKFVAYKGKELAIADAATDALVVTLEEQAEKKK